MENEMETAAIKGLIRDDSQYHGPRLLVEGLGFSRAMLHSNSNRTPKTVLTICLSPPVFLGI